MIRVLVVDDSAFMRNAIVSLLEKDPNIKVVGTAHDGQDALKKAADIDADVMTLDVEMPRLDGLGTLQALMKSTPLPVLMISSLTESGAESTLKAMEFGALDFIPKTMSNDKEVFGEELRRKVTALARRKSIIKLKYRRISTPPAAIPKAPQVGAASYAQSPCRGPRDLVVIGVSTGGPPVVQKILSALPADLPACILIAQHMPAAFTGPFAKRLDGVCKITVTEAVDGDKFKLGHAYVCPGGKHIGIRMRGALPEISVTEEPRDALYKPTVNLLMETAGKAMGRRTLGVMLTGMGADGCEGAKVLRETGGCLIAQSEASCVVYGMPKAVVDAKLANQILDADDIANAIITGVKG
ncbi:MULTISPECIES: chemotaxis response regulator protein-glutamate methylesterase [unclassified Desulfovibrio]|uniref:protein-glutamate methylesterase/protein-glutamine glutaminase n=1 Tax=unclassified Desulfovibrio TaxID=2593640 RepID=UPI000F5F240A|nr:MULTISPECIES: chemotaxis response regulator protein-glutamate methylesterase [unclassified Desulfovibrio]RRD71538.1 chemotaxis response regulator protein-glutamate methylesterase [Desulfovibrio sp. OH1209_COT-279]RRD87783.1 chemotaxis response regulator protein-glutamate methylesterase [Desulfovibrio sp. OH1186_COT-070]